MNKTGDFVKSLKRIIVSLMLVLDLSAWADVSEDVFRANLLVIESTESDLSTIESALDRARSIDRRDLVSSYLLFFGLHPGVTSPVYSSLCENPSEQVYQHVC